MIHILSTFGSIGGSELHAINLYKILNKHTNVQLWTYGKVSNYFDDRKINILKIRENLYPRKGKLIVVGNFYGPDNWIYSTEFTSIFLIWNTYLSDQYQNKMFKKLFEENYFEAQNGKKAKINRVYVSQMAKNHAGKDGAVLLSPLDVKQFEYINRNPKKRYIVGRHSRDALEKHNANDINVYKKLNANDIPISIMGGTCLGEDIKKISGLNTYEVNKYPVNTFLHSIDCFYYSTANN